MRLSRPMGMTLTWLLRRFWTPRTSLTSIVALFGLSLTSGASALSPYPPPPPPLPEQCKLHHPVRLYERVDQLPGAIRNDLGEGIPNLTHESTKPDFGPQAEQHQFVEAGQLGDTWFVWYRHIDSPPPWHFHLNFYVLDGRGRLIKRNRYLDSQACRLTDAILSGSDIIDPRSPANTSVPTPHDW